MRVRDGLGEEHLQLLSWQTAPVLSTLVVKLCHWQCVPSSNSKQM